ncbi:hypothetical protein WICMUC_001812 [Wickerhamomyces mucosus]|uniref:Protein kinase domain-containing protein n=1 Tax=Wickerhamomyces mucosus TaxID=1378264 RepID=A0A9P8PS28_9ASCO|nr:hypothetical protein WICMUC_001812 [Wickerhamomyces mucosus]
MVELLQSQGNRYKVSNILNYNNNISNLAGQQHFNNGIENKKILQTNNDQRITTTTAPKNKPNKVNKSGFVVYEEANFYISSRYHILKMLGKGSYGIVCSALDLTNRDNPVPIAIKKVTNIFTKDILLKRAVRELKLMRFFKGHKNIVNLYELDIVYCIPYDGLYCFQELADYDLARVIHSSAQFSEFHIKNFLYQILCGVKYIHSADVIHRDLKPGNILINHQGNLKICDFGLARGISPKFMKSKPNSITNYVATRWYRAPELILSRKKYSKAIDMWAVGCIFAELYARRALFMGSDIIHQATEILKVLGTPNRKIISSYGTSIAMELLNPPNPQYRPIPWNEILPYASNLALDLLGKLLCWDVLERYDVTQSIEHPFLIDIRDALDEPVCLAPFDFSFENTAITLNDYKILIHEEVESFKIERFGNSYKEQLHKGGNLVSSNQQ